MITAKKKIKKFLRKDKISYGFICKNRFPGKFPTAFTSELPAEFHNKICCRFVPIFGRKLRGEIF
jgi:hypothetical protein